MTQLKDGDDGLSYKYWRAWYGSKFKAEPDDGDIIASPRYFQRGDHDKVILVPKDIDDYLVKAAFWLGHVQGIRANPNKCLSHIRLESSHKHIITYES